MPEFVYQAKKGPNEVTKGKLWADTKQEAVLLIEQKGFVPIQVEMASPGAKPEGKKSLPRAARLRNSLRLKLGRKVSVYEVCVFTRQLSGFMRSQLPLLNALEFIKNQTPPASAMQELLDKIAGQVRNGKRFSDALEEFGAPYFDPRYISMVRAGEAGGSLDAILETLANHLEAEEEVRGQIRSALAYPALVVTVGVGTLFFLFTFCLPRLSGLFKSAFGTLPLPTRILMTFCRPEWQFFFYALLGALLIGAVVFFAAAKKNPRLVDLTLGRTPFLGQIRLKSDIARFASTLAMLIEHGVPIYQAIEATRPVLTNELLKEDLATAQDRIMGGEMLANIIRQSPNFPPFLAQMVAVGEDSGRLAASLKEIARFYSRESTRGIKVITSLIEPVFILGLSLVVGFVVAGIMLPIFDMSWVK